MSQSKGTPLYLQVEEALKDFQLGVGRLKAQQRETDSLLATGNEALENLVLQVACIEKLQDQVESDLRLLERFRQNTAQENDQLRQQILAEFSEHQEQIRGRVDNLKTDFGVRRQEILGLIRDLRQELKGIEQQWINTQKALNTIQGNEGAREKILAWLKQQTEMLQSYQQEVDRRLARAEKWTKYLLAAVLALAVLTLVELLF